jgi:hypothetical protein
MTKLSDTYWISFKKSLSLALIALVAFSCQWMDRNRASDHAGRIPVARVNNTFLYKDELAGIVSNGASREDSISRIQSYVNSWIRKQLLIQEATRKMDINEAAVERKILDYRYSIIAYEYQNSYIKQHLDTVVADADIEEYYKNNIDNFVLKQNIVKATYIKVPKSAPRTQRIKELMFSDKEEDANELKSYCLSFSAAHHLVDTAWIAFDELVRNSPMIEIPNKIEFLKSNPYYETSDANYLYFLKVNEYRVSDNVSPLEFVKDEIRNILLNKRKVELAKKLEDEVYREAEGNKDFEIY